MKQKLFGIAFVFMIAICGCLTACGVDYTNAKITVQNDTYDIVWNENGDEEANTINFQMKIQDLEEGTLSYSAKNDGVVLVKLNKENSTTYNVSVTAVRPGTAVIKVFLVENDAIYKNVTINVKQPIWSLSIKEDYEYYASVGTYTPLNLGTNLIVWPTNADRTQIKYEIVENANDLDVSISQDGVLNTTSCTQPGKIVVKLFTNDEIYTQLVVNVVQAVSANDVNVSMRYNNNKGFTNLWSGGEQVTKDIELIKTGSSNPELSYIADYSQANITIDTIYAFSQYEVMYKLDGKSAGSLFENGKWYTLDSNKLTLQSLQLGTTKLTIKINVKGAMGFLDDIVMEYNVNVIDAPTSIEVTDPTAENSRNIYYDELNKVYQCNVYDSYAEGIIGQAISFNVKPASVTEINAKIVLDVSDLQDGKIEFFDKDGIKLEPKAGKIEVYSNETLYVKSLTNENYVPTYEIKVYSKFSEKFVADGGALVDETLRISLYTGITSIKIEGKSDVYLDMTGLFSNMETISLNIGNASANTDFIYYEVENDGIVSVSKVNNLTYTVKGLSQGETKITFYSGNGYRTVLNAKVYVPVTSAYIDTESEFENGYIGYREFDDSGRLSNIAVQTQGSFNFDIITNEFATIHKIDYRIQNNEAGNSIIELQSNTNTIIVHGVGTAQVTVIVYGYTNNGVQTQGEARSFSFKVTGYIPVQNIDLSSTFIKVKDPSTVSYNKISNYCKANLAVSVNPSNATYKEEDITWSYEGDNCYLSNSTGLFTTLTALPIKGSDQDSYTFTVTVSLKVFGRTLTKQCIVVIEKAVKVSNIYVDNVPFGQLTFDSRKGLGDTSNNKVKLDTRILPEDAFDKSLQYDVVYSVSNDKSGNPVFSVSQDGVVTPLRGGMGILRIAPQDSFVNADKPDENVCKYITIVVEDGTTEATAYSVANAQDLKNIGATQQSLASYYKLANNISLIGHQWKSIGDKNNPFTGWFSGSNIIYEKVINEDGEYELVPKEKIQYTISGLTIVETLDASVSGDKYYGLFGYVKGKGLYDVDIEFSNVSIDVSKSNANIYFGGVAAFVESDFCSPDVPLEDCVISTISNCSARSLSKISIKTSKGANYIGGMVGYDKFSTVENVDKLSIDFTDFEINVTANVPTYIGGLIGFVEQGMYKVTQNDGKVYYFTDKIIVKGANYMKISDNVSTDTDIIYSTFFNKSGYDVYISNLSIVTSANITSNIAVGGAIGKSIYSEITINSGEDVNVDLPNFDKPNANDDLGMGIEDLSVYANINAYNSALNVGVDNVGGIVGDNSLLVQNVYFDGEVHARQNVGGVIGYNTGLLDRTRVYTYDKDGVITGVDNVGGLVGNFTNIDKAYSASLISFSYVSGLESNEAVKTISTGTHIGALVGLVSKLTFVACYSDIQVAQAFTLSEGAIVSFNYSYVVDSSIPSGVTMVYSYEATTDTEISATYYNETSTSVDQATFLSNTLSYFALPSAIGEEYKNINFGLPVIKYNQSYLYNIVFTSMEIELQSSDRFTIIKNSKEEKNILLFYYELDSAYSAKLTADKRAEINSILRKENTYEINELLTLLISPKPFSNVMINVECIDDKGNVSSIAYIDDKGNIIVRGEGNFILKFTSKLNPTLSVELNIAVTNYISNFGIYKSNNVLSLEYDYNQVIDIRKDTSKDAFVIFESLYNGEHVLKSSNSTGLMFKSTFNPNDTTNIIELDMESLGEQEKGPLYGLYVNGESYIFGDYLFDDAKGGYVFEYYEGNEKKVIDLYLDAENTIRVDKIQDIMLYLFSSTKAQYFNSMLIGDESDAVYHFEMNIEGVLFKGTCNSLSSGEIVWTTDNKDAVISGNEITVNGNVYRALNLFGYTDIKNSLYVCITKEEIPVEDGEGGTTTQINYRQSFANGVFVEKHVYMDNPNILTLTAKTLTNGYIEAYPYITTYTASGEEVRTIINSENIHTKTFGYRVYEGSKKIEADIDKVEYSPTDAINMQVYLYSDTELDGIEYVKTEDNKNLIVNVTKSKVEKMENGDYKYTYDINITLENTYNARYFSESKTFDLTFRSTTIDDVSITKQITYLPQVLQRLDVLNYQNITASVSNEKMVINKNVNASPSAYISAGSNGLMSIDMYPSYSDVDILQISSDMYNGYFINFWQMTYDGDSNGNSVYKEIEPASQYGDNGMTMIFQKVTSQTNGNVFDGKLYVRTYLDASVPAGTIYTVTVSGYKRNKLTNELELVLSNDLKLEVSGAPHIDIDTDGLYDNYAIKGRIVTSEVVISNMGTVTGEPTILPELVGYTSTNELDSIIMVGDIVKEINGSVTKYKYSMYVGPDVPVGTKIKVTARVSYQNQGIEQEQEVSDEFTVTDYIIQNVNLSKPFNTLNNYATFYTYESNYVSIESVDLLSMLKLENLPKEVNITSSYALALYNMLENYGGWVDGNKTYPITFVDNKYQVTKGNKVIYLVFNNETKEFTAEKETDKQELENMTYKEGLKTNLTYLKNKLNVWFKEENSSIQIYNEAEDAYSDLPNTSSESSTIVRSADSESVGIILMGRKTGNGNKLRLAFNYDMTINKATGSSLVNIKELSDSQKTENTFINVKYTREFVVDIVLFTNENLPQEIEDQVDFEKMESGKDYILMNNLVLNNYKPINANMASLDGNSKTIKIKSFSQDALYASSANIGLFNTISPETLIKNLTLDMAYISTIDLSNSSTASVGLFAITNNGTITNCAVVNTSSSTTQITYQEKTMSGVTVYEEVSNNVKLNIIMPKNYSTVPKASMFVVTNTASITHSRVMKKGESASIFSVVSSGEMAGFAISNTGHISSSYVANITLKNELSVVKDSKTSGFVITNNSEIMQCFVMGSRYNSSSDKDYKANIGYLFSNGVVSGFVYDNQLDIKDCYANISLISNANVAGFVYTNGVKGTIENAYGACNIHTNSAVHMPFIGVDDLSNILNENPIGLTNCYYISASALGSGSDDSYIIDTETYPATEVYANKFSNSTSFGGFSFGDKIPNTSLIGDTTQESVWYMDSTIGPSLYSAENLAEPERTVNITDDGVKVFNYVEGKELGTAKNPIIISNAEEYNLYMARVAGTGIVVADSYIRVVNNINFNDVQKEVVTTRMALSKSNIEGNGFKLQNVVLKSNNVSGAIIDSLGLFAYIDSSNVRNMDIEIAQADCENVKVLGALAGVVTNSTISNVEVTSEVVMSARFVAGGIIGALFGDSEILNLSASVGININYKPSVSTTKPNTYNSGLIDGTISYADKNTVKLNKIDVINNISYAGGVIGIFDTTLGNADKSERFSIGGENARNIKTYGEVTLNGQFVGGVVGYIGTYSHISNAVFEMLYNDVDNKQYLDTEYCTGGIAAVNYGTISRSAVKHSDFYNDIVENEILSYLKTGVDNRKGKQNLFKGDMWIVGGLVGINYVGNIIHSYSHANIEDRESKSNNITEQYLGGVIGWTYLGNIDTLYSIGNVYTAKSVGYVGGMIGRYNRISYNAEDTTIAINNLYAINLWKEDDVTKLFAEGSTRAGVIIGYIGQSGAQSEGEANISATRYIDDIRVAGGENYLEGSVYTLQGEDKVTKPFGTNRDTHTQWEKLTLKEQAEAVTSNFTYADILTNDDKSSLVNDFFKGLYESNKEIWIYNVSDLPRLKMSAISSEANINNIFEFLAVLKSTPYKSMLIEKDLDFDLRNYSIDGSSIKYNGESLEGVNIGSQSTITTAYGSITAEDLCDANVPFNQILNDESTYEINFRNFTQVSFTGKIMSNKTDENNAAQAVKFSNLNFTNTINHSGGRDVKSYGIFDTTRKATFNNIIFEVENVDYSSGSAVSQSFAVVSQNDYSSSFADVKVEVIGNNEVIGDNELRFNNYVFGGFVGQGFGTTTFTNCSFSGKVTYTNAKNSGEIKKYVGAFVGNSNFTVMRNCSANVTINYTDEQDGNNYYTYIGGYMGYTRNVVMSNCTIESFDTKSKNIINATQNASTTYRDCAVYIGGTVGSIELSGTIQDLTVNGDIGLRTYSYLRAGGVVGQSKNTTFANVNVGSVENPMQLSVTEIRGNSVGIGADGLYLGGLVGDAIVTQLNQDNMSNSCKVYIDIDVTNGEMQLQNEKSFSVGGAIGIFNSQATQGYTNQNVSVKGTIDINNVSKQINVGGVIGENLLTKAKNANVSPVKFVNTNAFVDITINETEMQPTTLYAGGFLGYISGRESNDKGTYIGTLEVQLSFVAGSISSTKSETSGYIGAFAGSFEGSILGCTIATSLYMGSNMGLDKGKGANNLNVSSVFGSANSSTIGSYTDANTNTTTETYVLDEIIGYYTNTGATSKSTFTVIGYNDWLTYVKDNKLESRYSDLDISKSGEILNPNKTKSQFVRYNYLSSTLLKTGMSTTDEENRVIVTDKSTIGIITTSLFENIGIKTIVSSVVLKGNSASVPLLANTVKGTVLGVYATGSSNAENLLISTLNGSITDVMINVNQNVTSGGNVSAFIGTMKNAYVNNVQVLGSVNVKDGITNNIYLLSGIVNDVNYIENAVVATNVVSNNKDNTVDLLSASCTYNNVNYDSNIISSTIGEGYSPNYTERTMKDLPFVNSTYDINHNYGYPYLTRFETQMTNFEKAEIDMLKSKDNTGDRFTLGEQKNTLSNVNVANNYSRLSYMLANSKMAVLNNNINLTWKEDKALDISKTYSNILDGSGFGIYGLSLNSNNTKTGTFNNLTNAKVQNITISYNKLNSENSNYITFTGTLAANAKETTFRNVTITSTHTDYLRGMAVGGIVGKASGCTFNDVKTSNIEVVAYDSAGIAGGFVAYATGTTINNSTSGTLVIGGNAPSGAGNDAGVVGGFVAISSGGNYTSNTLTNYVVTGDAQNGAKNDQGEGTAGGNVYIGGVVGKSKTDIVNISTSQITYKGSGVAENIGQATNASTYLTYKGKANLGNKSRISRPRSDNYAAGRGGDGNNGSDGTSHPGGTCWWGWGECHKVTAGSDGKKGGDGGKTYIGYTYGYQSGVNYVRNGDLKTTAFSCAPGGNGGSGGKGGGGAMFVFWHYTKQGGNGASSGNDGNGENLVEGKNAPGKNNTTRDMQPGGAGGAFDNTKCTYCYLQS